MSFTDAWYLGTAALSGVRAVFCASVRSIPALLRAGDAVAATVWSWAGVTQALAPIVTVDTRASSWRTPLERSLAKSMLTIEIVRGAVTGPAFHIAIRSSANARCARRAPLCAPAAGRFAPRREIGERVAAGDPLGSIGTRSLVAPIGGVLRRVSARGARVQLGDLVAEVDPDAMRGDCFERDAEAVMVASAVAEAVRDERPNDAAAGPR